MASEEEEERRSWRDEDRRRIDEEVGRCSTGRLYEPQGSTTKQWSRSVSDPFLPPLVLLRTSLALLHPARTPRKLAKARQKARLHPLSQSCDSHRPPLPLHGAQLLESAHNLCAPLFPSCRATSRSCNSIRRTNLLGSSGGVDLDLRVRVLRGAFSFDFPPLPPQLTLLLYRRSILKSSSDRRRAG